MGSILSLVSTFSQFYLQSIGLYTITTDELWKLSQLQKPDHKTKGIYNHGDMWDSPQIQDYWKPSQHFLFVGKIFFFYIGQVGLELLDSSDSPVLAPFPAGTTYV